MEYDPLQPRLGVDCVPTGGLADYGPPFGAFGGPAKGAVAGAWGTDALGGSTRAGKRQRLGSM